MPLQIRRGLDSQRTTITPAAGELIYVTDSQKLYIGDGTTVGGIAVTGFTTEDAYDATAQIFANGTHTNITFTHNDVANSLSAVVSLNTLTENLNAGGFNISNIGDITGTGSITFDGIVTADFKGSVFATDSGLILDAENRSVVADLLGNVLGADSTLLVNHENSSINLDQTIKSNAVPFADASYNLGSAGLRFNNLFLTEAITMGGSIRRDTDSFVMMDVGENFINLDGTIKGDIVPDTSNTVNIGNLGFRFGNLYLGTAAGTSGGRSIIIDNVQIRGENTSLFLPSSFFVGTVPITAVGSHIDLPLGSTVDGVPIGSGGGGGDGVIPGNNYNINIVADDSTLMLDAQNNEIITVTLSAAFIQSDDSSDITVRNRTVFESDIIVQNEIRGFLIGDVEGETRGNHIGPVLSSDSTMLVDTANQAFYGDLTGNVTGNLNGNVTGNLLGNVTGNLTGSVNAGSGTITAGQVFGTNLFGRLYGDIYSTQNIEVYDGDETWRGNFIGDLTGSVFSDNSTRIVDGESGAVTAPSVSVTDFLQLPVFANDGARGSAIPTPAAGMVVFMVSGTAPVSTNQPQYFDGSNWQNF